MNKNLKTFDLKSTTEDACLISGERQFHSPTILFMKLNFNPLTPMPALTGRDEPWPFFHFWRHHFWPKLASSILNFCRRRRSFQWCPDQSDQPNGAWDMHKNVQKVERKTRTKICCHYTWLLHGKNCPSRLRSLRSFLTASKLNHCSKRKRKGEKGKAKKNRRLITAAKGKEKETKRRRKKKKFQKSKSLKTEHPYFSKHIPSQHP